MSAIADSLYTFILWFSLCLTGLHCFLLKNFQNSFHPFSFGFVFYSHHPIPISFSFSSIHFTQLLILSSYVEFLLFPCILFLLHSVSMFFSSHFTMLSILILTNEMEKSIEQNKFHFFYESKSQKSQKFLWNSFCLLCVCFFFSFFYSSHPVEMHVFALSCNFIFKQSTRHKHFYRTHRVGFNSIWNFKKRLYVALVYACALKEINAFKILVFFFIFFVFLAHFYIRCYFYCFWVEIKDMQLKLSAICWRNKKWMHKYFNIKT